MGSQHSMARGFFLSTFRAAPSMTYLKPPCLRMRKADQREAVRLFDLCAPKPTRKRRPLRSTI